MIRRRKAFFGEKAPFPVAGNRSPENFTAFPPLETVFRAFFPFSRRGKPFFERFFHFPRREGVFRRFFPISRGGKAFCEVQDRFRVSVWRFVTLEIDFVFQFGVSLSPRSVLCFRRWNNEKLSPHSDLCFYGARRK